MKLALHAAGFLFASLPVAAQRTYQVVDLDTPPGGSGRGAEDINERGDAVGSSFVGGAFRPVLYQDGSAIDLGVLPGGVGYASATGINERGEVCGVSATSTAFRRAFVWDAQNGMRDIGSLGGLATDVVEAYAINDLGQITGSSTAPGGSEQHLFVWDEAAGMRDLGTLPGDAVAEGLAINNAGQICGRARVLSSSAGRPFRYDPGLGLRELPMVDPTKLGEAKAITETGVVVGSSTAGRSLLARWDGTTLTSLGKPTWARDAYGYGANSSGQLVGLAWEKGAIAQRAFLYEDGAYHDLNALIPTGSGWQLGGATAVNEAGQIVGSGKLNGADRPFRLDPPTRLRAQATVGGAATWTHDAPRFAGQRALTAVSATGGATRITLPGGLSFRLDVDSLTTPLLARTRVLLDAQGHGVTPTLPVPNDPTLVGRPFWSVSLVQDVATGRILAASTTVYDTLE